MSVWQRYTYILKALENFEELSYNELTGHLEWLNSQNLEHTRPGFEYWFKAFKQIPEHVRTLEDVDRFMEQYIFGEGEFHCTVLNTVNIGMMAFTTALKEKHHKLCEQTFFTEPREAVVLATFGPERRWTDRLDLAAKRKGIKDKEVWCKEVEKRQAAKTAENKKLYGNQ